jgi:hypothetical protein
MRFKTSALVPLALLAPFASAQLLSHTAVAPEPADGSELVLPASMPPLHLMPTLDSVGGVNGALPDDLGRSVRFNPQTGEQSRSLPSSAGLAHEPSAGIGMAPFAYDDRNWLFTSSPDPALYPARTTCKVAVRFDDNGVDRWVTCSGTLIDASTLLLAAPSIYDRASNLGWARDVYVFPGWDGAGSIAPPASSAVFNNYGFARGTFFTVGASWFDDGLYSGAIGAVTLDRAVGAVTGWASYEAAYTGGNTCRSYPSGPGCYPAGTELVARTFAFNPPPQGLTELRWVFNLPAGGCNYIAFPGMMGAAVTNSPDSSLFPIAYSVLTDWNNGNYTSFTPITPGFVSFLDDWVAESRGNSFDLEPLDVNVVGNVVVAGQPVGSASVRIINATNASAPSRTYTCRVYLSTNADISTGDTLIGTVNFTRSFAAMGSVTLSLPDLAIPSTVSAGDYYLGVILDSTTDGFTANNDTDGWDAQLITVEPPVPNNNLCRSSAVLPFNTTITLSNLGATNDGASLCGGSAATHEDAWYRFTAPYTGRFVMEGQPGGTIVNAVLSVHTGCPGTTSNSIACDAGDTSFEPLSLNANLTEGQTVYVRFAGQNNTNGTMPLRVRPAVPLNDTCAGAANVGVGAVTGTTQGSTADAPPCFGENGGDVYYSFLVNCPGLYSVDLSESTEMTDTIVTVYSGCPSSGGTLIACDNDSGLGQHAYATFLAPSSQFFTIRVAAPTVADRGQFTMRIRAVYSAGDIDSCQQAAQVQTGVAEPFTTCVATPSPVNTQSGCTFGLNNTIGPDVWYLWNAPEQSVTATASLCGSDFDTVMLVYEATCPIIAGPLMGCNDNACGDDAVVTWTTQPNALYAIRIGGAAATPFLINARGSGELLVTAVGQCAWSGDGCFADFNNDSGIDSDDVITYFQEWDASGPCADVTGDGGVDSDDVIGFFSVWDAGGAGLPGC